MSADRTPDANAAPTAREHRVAGYLGPSEDVIHATRQHPMAIGGAFVSAIGWLIPVALVMWGVTGLSLFDNVVGTWISYAAVLAIIIVVARLAWDVAGWEFERLVVTTEKVMYVHGIFAKNVSSTPLVKVSETTVSQSLIGRALGYGALIMDSPGGGSRPLHGLRFIPDPPSIYRMISDLGRQRRTLEGGGRLDGREPASHEPEPDPGTSGDDDAIGETRIIDP